ncbi:hypothetical protein B9G98_03205 [Wickerhamiella sorbophila]|uniref:Oxidoreductase n=1 Tax=Wickerhamiella sorbophila TaxID=45607 RepID=A0A2T0FKT1_9ASCO|nr:hypothetical protein B9G98_03205 [Wickerhamiella sorbophila]PRT55585.1 hypothetical protein B9G98_03205 [Wickerhamiella sorbophila]
MSVKGIEGKVIVITGASSGLGETSAHELTKAGAKVVVGARRVDKLRALVKEFGLPEESAVEVDVSKQEQVENLIQTALKLYGKIDVLMNNAGVATFSPIEAGDVDAWDRMIDTNVKGVLYGVNAVLPHFKERKSGQIINTCSVVGHSVMRNGVVYSSTKFAIRAISEGLRQELKPHNIRVLNISPGPTESEGLRVAFGEASMPTAPSTAFSDAVIYAVSQPENVDINEITFRPTALD